MDGRLIGHYRVLEKIGAGAMGEVFRARDERLGRDVALKLIRPSYSDNPDHLRRFEQESRAAAALNHPNIVAVYDVGFEGTSPYIVEELLEGKTLRQRLSEGPFPIRQAAGYGLQIAQGLSAAHDRHIVHRDLKPENLFLTNDDRIKILDFGVAKLQLSGENYRSPENLTTVTKHGAVIGTVAYMSPEQLRGRTVDHRSDIFSFGAILYELLSGKRAFHGETEVDTMTAVLREEPASANLDEAAIPTAYQEIVRHCVEKEPENRFQSLGEGSSGSLSADGEWVAALSIHEPDQITLLPVGAGQLRTIHVTGLEHVHSGWARFLPDAQELAVNGDEPGHAARCYLVNLSTGRARAVTPEGLVCGPISPDGRFIIGKATNAEISAFPVGGGMAKTLVGKKSNFNPVEWSQDGASLYGYHEGEFPSKVYKLNLAGGKETAVRELKPGSPAGVAMVAPVVVSRDGKNFAYSYNQTLSALYVVSGLH